MAHHQLMLDAPDTLNGCIMKIQDSSSYATGVAVTCPRLLVQVPGFTTAVEIPNPQPGFIYNFTACDLKIQTVQCGTEYYDLPDGIYILKYSVSPNDYVYVEYNHLRITAALKLVREILCDLDRGACEPPEKIKSKMMELSYIQMVLLGAKTDVETCLKPRQGWANYLYALKLLNKLRCSTTAC